MVRIALTVLVATLALGGVAQSPALGQNAAPAKSDDKPGPPSQRYRFSHSAEGVLRLDNETGQVVLCRPLNGGWVCNPAPEETAVLQVELKRKDAQVQKLTAAFAQLKREVAAARSAAADRQKSLQRDVTRLQAAIATLKAEIAALTGKMADAPEQSITQEERHGLVSRLALLEQDNGGLKGAVARLEDENAKFKTQVVTPEERQGVVSRFALLEQDNSALNGVLARLEEANARLTKQIAELPKHPDLEPAIAQAIAANGELKRDLATAKAQLAALQDQVSAQSDGNAQQAAIDQLKKENAALTDKLASLATDNALMQGEIDALKPPPPPMPQAEVPADKQEDLKLPSREDMERARVALGEAWRKLMDMIGQLQKDMMGGKDAPPVRL